MHSPEQMDPMTPSMFFLGLGRSIFEPYTLDYFSSDASFRRFARNALQMLGLINPIESHSLLYDSVLLPESDISVQDRAHSCPEVIAQIGTEKLGLCWLDSIAIKEHLGLSCFTTSRLNDLLAHPLLCDPYYGLAIVPGPERWIHASFTLDWMIRRERVIGKGMEGYYKNPSRILSDGAETANIFWSNLLDSVGRASLAQGIPADVRIESMSQLRELVSALNDALSVTNGNSRVWFRGQNCEYLMVDRSAAVVHGYLPYANIRDASLVTSLYRNANVFSGARAAYRKFLIDVLAWEKAAEIIFGPAWIDVPLGTSFPEEEFGDGPEFSSTTVMQDANSNVVGGRTRHMTMAKSAWQRGLLLQHYGCPTPFLDVTSSIDIAHWFATHKFEGPGASPLFRPHSWAGEDHTKWPTIYCFILAPHLQPIIDSTRVNSGNASARAHRQECGLLGGGGLLARNYAARFIGLKLRLHPNLCGQSKLTTEDLFPDANTDSVYRELQKIACIGSDNMFPLYGI